MDLQSTKLKDKRIMEVLQRGKLLYFKHQYFILVLHGVGIKDVELYILINGLKGCILLF